MSETQEKIYYESGVVKVTNSRFIVASQTYAMSGITSVKFFTETPSKVGAVIAFLIAIVALFNQANIWVIAIPLVIGIGLWLRKATHHVILSTASGETKALESQNKEFIASVIQGLNDAIIARG
jgi:hypothetical protein